MVISSSAPEESAGGPSWSEEGISDTRDGGETHSMPKRPREAPTWQRPRQQAINQFLKPMKVIRPRSGRTSKSYRLRHSSSGGFSSARCFRAFSSLVSSLGLISMPVRSTGPRCFSFGRYCSRVPGGWIGSLQRGRGESESRTGASGKSLGRVLCLQNNQSQYKTSDGMTTLR